MTKVLNRQASPCVVETLKELNKLKKAVPAMAKTSIHSAQSGPYNETSIFTVLIGGEPAKRAVRMSNVFHDDDTSPIGTPLERAQAVVFETYAVLPAVFSTSKTRRYWTPSYFEPRYTPPSLVNGFPDPTTIKLIKRSFVADLHLANMQQDILNFLNNGTLPT